MLDQSGVPFPASSGRSRDGGLSLPGRVDDQVEVPILAGMLGASSCPQRARPRRAAVSLPDRVEPRSGGGAGPAQIRPWSAGIGESVECNARRFRPPTNLRSVPTKSSRNSATRRQFRRVSSRDKESPDTPPITRVIALRRRVGSVAAVRAAVPRQSIATVISVDARPFRPAAGWYLVRSRSRRRRRSVMPAASGWLVGS